MFKIALTLLLACAADPYVPTPVSLRAGDGAGGAQSGRDLPAVGGASGGVGCTQDGTSPGARALWLQRAGASGSYRRPKPSLCPAGGVRLPPPLGA